MIENLQCSKEHGAGEKFNVRDKETSDLTPTHTQQFGCNSSSGNRIKYSHASYVRRRWNERKKNKNKSTERIAIENCRADSKESQIWTKGSNC